MVSAKGKEKVSDSGGKGKRKLSDTDDKTGRRKRKNPGVLQFFDDSAYQVDDDESESDESLFDDDFYDDEFFQDHKSNDKNGKAPVLPFVKQEDISDDELERMLEERYKPGAGFVKYAEDRYEHETSNDRDVHVPSANDPVIWKVKCMVGRERYSAFCLMQKFVELEYLKTTKLHILSAFALDHVKGFIFIEAEKQNNIYEACTGLCSIYPTKVAPVPSNEMSRLLSVRSKSNAISVGTWARVKRGRYKGDLALVVAVNDARKKVTAKLIPRIDLKAMAEKIGGGLRAKMTAIPPQRLISSSELDEFRPLIHSRRDRDTNEMVEVLDGMMLKDGYLFKKIPIDSLSFWGVLPTEAELLKFEPSNKDESTDVQWVSQLFGEKKQKEMEPVMPSKHDKGSGKSEASTSASISGKNFELHDLVFFNRKDFGVVIGTSEKDDSIKVIKEGADGPLVVSVNQSELKTALFDKKLFSVLDHHSKTILINDTVRVLDGPLKDRQGVVKKIYKGVLFLFDESEQENSGYICIKAQLCEKVGSGEASDEKGGELGPSGFAEMFSSPKSPLSPEKTWEEKDNRSSFKRDDDAMFAVGQSLRIRVGPLKGYLCRVIAIRRTDVTVKLDSKQKILTVKSEHLTEVRGRSSAISQGGESLSSKPFDFLGTQDAGTGWGSGTTLSTEGGLWNAGGSTERSSWAGFDSKEPGSADPVDDDTKKGAADSSWQTKPISTENSSWGAPPADKKVASDDAPASGWGTSGGWNQTSSSAATNTGSDGWGKTADTSTKDNSWGAAAEKLSTGDDTSGSKSVWGQPPPSAEKTTGGWGNAGGDMKKDDRESSWGKAKEPVTEGASDAAWGAAPSGGTTAWGAAPSGGTTAWGAAPSGVSGDNVKEASGWGSASTVTEDAGNGKGSWDKEVKQTVNSSSAWNSGTTAADGNKSPQGNWGSQKSSEPSTSWNQNGNSGSWNTAKKDADGGSSTGWGGGNKESSWSSKGNWNSGGGGFGSENNNQNDGSSDRGRGGGGWRGGRGGRGDRGGFQGRGRSDFGGNQESTWGSKPSWSSGDNNSQDDSSNGGGGWRGGRGDRGGFRGRGDGGRFGGGRGGGDGEGGFRGGRGGFRGRGRGDFNNRGSDNEGNKSEGWKSNGGGNSWGSSGGDNKPSWGSSGGDNKPSWGSSGGGNSWGSSGGDNKPSWGSSGGGNSQGGGWGSSNADANTSSGGWNKQSPKNDGGGGWGSSNTNTDAPKKDTGGGWGSSAAAAASGGSPGGWKKQSPKKDTGGEGWGSSNAGASEGNPAASSWGASASGNGEKEKDGAWGGGGSKW